VKKGNDVPYLIELRVSSNQAARISPIEYWGWIQFSNKSNDLYIPSDIFANYDLLSVLFKGESNRVRMEKTRIGKAIKFELISKTKLG
jgi:hypothetical protein